MIWIKQDPAYRSNSTVMSHVNSDRKAGWYVEYYTKGSQSHNIKFSVPNSAVNEVQGITIYIKVSNKV